jgi:uncharacterized Ntn-hydrolase superfamily protein
MRFVTIVLFALGLPGHTLIAQEPASWRGDLVFHTFSIAALDPVTGQTGVAVTTRVACVGNAVPWVRAGVGAVATQAFTRVEYGTELLDLLESGVSAEEALQQVTGADSGLARRQVGVISAAGAGAQHTGDSTSFWAGQVAGPNYVTQGNLLTGPEVLEAVGATFERTENSGRHLADRLIEALAAGQATGGDARKGRVQSAAIVVADPREGASRRPDGVVTNINVCEHPTPVAELRRIYNTVSETLGFRTLEQNAGRDVWQLRVILHELGHYLPNAEMPTGNARFMYSQDLVDAVDAFRAANGLSTPDVGSPPGLVDAQALALMWEALERAGRARAVRERLLDITAIRR